MRGGSCCSPNVSLFSIRKTRLLVGIGRTFEPTRSGTGSFARSRHAHALGQGLPLIRALLQILHHGSQARLRTCPDLLGDGGDGLLWSQVGQEEGRVQIALHRSQPACAGMPALRPGFLHIPSTVMAILTQFGLECRDARPGCRQFLQPGVSNALQTALGRPRPMLRPYCFCHPLNEVFSRWMVLPTFTMS